VLPDEKIIVWLIMIKFEKAISAHKMKHESFLAKSNYRYCSPSQEERPG
jgi:hypothetical protein